MNDAPHETLNQATREPIAHSRSGLVSLHPAIYKLFIVLAALFALASWTYFGGGKYSGLSIAVVTLLIGFAIFIVTDIAHIWHGHHDRREDPGEPTESFHEWLRRPVKIERDSVSGKSAAIMALLPVMAGGLGMVALAIAHLIAVG